MITKKQFITVIKALQTNTNFLEDINNYGIDMYEIPSVESLYTLERIFFDSNFTKECCDTISWWLYEYEDKSVVSMWSEDGSEIPLSTVDELWDYCKQYLI